MHLGRRRFLTGAAAAAAAVALPAAMRMPLALAAESEIVRFNVISDIQGDLGDLKSAFADMADINPGSAGLAIAGDITPRGFDSEYASVAKVFANNSHADTVAWAIGNHEFYVPKWKDENTLAQDTWPNGVTEDSLFRSFYNFAGRNTIYAETLFGGIPVLSIGTERYQHYYDKNLWDEVWISEAQFNWLADRLSYWSGRRKPIMVISHHPLPDSVSGSNTNRYNKDYTQIDRLLGLLGKYPDLFFFSGHTHWDLGLPDWIATKVVPGAGNAKGFTTINTGCIQTGYTTDGHGDEQEVGPQVNQGLQIEVSDSAVTIKARDFAARRWLQSKTVPLQGGGGTGSSSGSGPFGWLGSGSAQ
ncbi:DUF4073 domain-containing protein [Nocardia sp. NPDC088792]|uniref:DUF4073 domain-containing protein n=1 Tax=Nocardia sp. NPDC088792 TaxID=3364332 RepID=UPI003804DAF9